MELDGRDDLDGHDGLENDGFRLEVRLAERANGGDAERKLRRVECVERTVAEDRAGSLRGCKAPQRSPSRPRGCSCSVRPSPSRRRVRSRFAISARCCPITCAYCPAPPFCFLYLYANSARSVTISRNATCGRAGNAVLALHSLDVNLKVELAHSHYDCLMRYRKCHHALRMRNMYLLAFAVDVDPERQVFLLEPVQ